MFILVSFDQRTFRSADQLEGKNRLRALHLAIGVLVVLVHMFCYYGLESSTDRGVRGTFVLGLAETITQCMTCALKPSYFVAFLC